MLCLQADFLVFFFLVILFKPVHFRFHVREISLRPLFLHTLYLHSFALKLTSLSLSPSFISSHPTPHFPLSSVGRLLIEFSSQMTMERVQKENPNVTDGGRYTPPDCRPRWKVCTHTCGTQQVNCVRTNVRTNGPTD